MFVRQHGGISSRFGFRSKIGKYLDENRGKSVDDLKLSNGSFYAGVADSDDVEK